MPGLFTTTDKQDARRRGELNALLVSLDCDICPAPVGRSCDYHHDDRELMVRLNQDPALFAHVPRIARVIAARPRIRSLVLAQFDDGQAPAELTGEKTCG